MAIEEYLDNAIANWRDKRDKAFKEHGLNVSEVYAKGDFENLPFDCLVPVCYVDAFNSVKVSLNSLKEGD